MTAFHEKVAVLINDAKLLLTQEAEQHKDFLCSEEVFKEFRHWKASIHLPASHEKKSSTPPPPALPKKQIPPKTKIHPLKNTQEKETKKEKYQSIPPPAAPSNEFFKLDPLSTPKVQTLHDVEKIVKEIAPNLNLLEDIPDDKAAKEIGNKWEKNIQPHVIVLYCYENHSEQAFLSHVTKAIERYLSPAALLSSYAIDKKGRWQNMLELPSLKLVLTTEATIHAHPSLQQFYGVSSQKQGSSLGKIPLLLLKEVAHYIGNAQSKAELWKSLCQYISMAKGKS